MYQQFLENVMQEVLERKSIKNIDFNCDLAQAYGVYKNTNEFELLDYVSSVNISSGFHAGDPVTIKDALLKAKEKNLAIRNIMILDAERKRICRFLEDNKIWYMLLKGVHLKEYYPVQQMPPCNLLLKRIWRLHLNGLLDIQKLVKVVLVFICIILILVTHLNLVDYILKTLRLRFLLVIHL